MKLLTILLLNLTLFACSASTMKNEQQTSSFVLTNVNIVDVDNKVIQTSKDIAIVQGKIKAIDNSGQLSGYSNLTKIEGKGGYVTPGLIDMHVHMYEEAAYVLSLSHGVTHVRIMNGVPKQLQWRDDIESGVQLGSTSTVSSPIISGYKDAYLHHGVDNAADASAAVRHYYTMGYDLIKAYGNLNEVSLKAVVEQGHQLGMPIAKHGPHSVGEIPISALSELQSFEHVEDIFQGPLNYDYSPERLANVIPAIKVTGVPVTATLNIYDQLTQLSVDKDDYLSRNPSHYISDIIALEAKNNQVDRWLNASGKMAEHNQKTLVILQKIAKALHEHEVTLLVGSDSGVLLSPHGLATHNEMRLLYEAGINHFDVLAAATINPAKALKLDTQIGRIAVNYYADFIFSDDNPIQNLSVLKTPIAVIKRGHWYSQEKLKQMRDEAIDNRSFWQELTTIFEAL